jgi:Fe-S-cluster containining protein
MIARAAPLMYSHRTMSFDCTKCPGYCCSHERIAVSDYDIERLAKHFGLSAKAARKKLTYRYQTADINEQILRHHKDSIYKSICHLFDRDKRQCTVYEARPHVCRKYPYGNTCGYYNFLKFERTFHDEPDFIPSA